MPPAGIGLVSVVYQDINNTNHRLTDGSLFDGYDSREPRSAVQSRLRVHGSLLVLSGRPIPGLEVHGPEPSFFGLAVDDCFCWNHGWQDCRRTARYNVANGAFALTPSVSFGVPTHDYDYFGEAVLGRNLNEVRVAWTTAGASTRSRTGSRCPAAIRMRLSRRSSICRTIAATWRSKPDSWPRESWRRELGFTWQRSHGGLRSTEVVTEERSSPVRSAHQGQQLSHHRRRVVFAAEGRCLRVLHDYAGGTDTHVGHAVTAGLSFPWSADAIDAATAESPRAFSRPLRNSAGPRSGAEAIMDCASSGHAAGHRPVRLHGVDRGRAGAGETQRDDPARRTFQGTGHRSTDGPSRFRGARAGLLRSPDDARGRIPGAARHGQAHREHRDPKEVGEANSARTSGRPARCHFYSRHQR